MAEQIITTGLIEAGTPVVMKLKRNGYAGKMCAFFVVESDDVIIVSAFWPLPPADGPTALVSVPKLDITSMRAQSSDHPNLRHSKIRGAASHREIDEKGYAYRGDADDRFARYRAEDQAQQMAGKSSRPRLVTPTAGDEV